MYLFRRFAVLLVILIPASFAALAQSSSNSPESTSQAPAGPGQAQQAPSPQTVQSGEASVQARIRARREQRRVQALHDTYSHLYEVFVGSNYQRFVPGPNLQHVTMYSWDVAVTRYLNPRLGVTFDGRGNYGTAFVGLNPTSVTRPAISHYDALVGPTYRLLMHPKYSIAGRVMGGVAMGNFSGDTNGFGTKILGLHSDGTTYAFTVGVVGEVNLTPNMSLRLAPEYFASGFGSTLQNDWGATYGLVYRLGKGR